MNPEMQTTATYRWEEISKVPQEPGIYSWYYSPEITDKDLGDAIAHVRNMVSEDKTSEAKAYLIGFLDRFVFGYFKEDPYNVLINGALKPQYKGVVHHSSQSSQALISRLIEQPERLATIKQVLEEAAPNFSSPIYIGMADKLGKRLKEHKKLIEKYREEKVLKPVVDTEDHNFAKQICDRNIPPACLFVIVKTIQTTEKNYVDAENILNRINYPILGRN